MSADVFENFKAISPDMRSKLADLKTTRLKAFGALKIAADMGMKRLSYGQLSQCLEDIGIVVNIKTLRNTLSQERRTVSISQGPDGQAYVKLMIDGERLIDEFWGRGNLSVLSINGDQPHSSKKSLRELISGLSGEVFAFDTYFGLSTIEFLECFSRSAKVKFMTVNVHDKGPRLDRSVKDFIKEFPNIQIRASQGAGEMHDRFVVDQNCMLMLGHGLKDLAKKDSFVVVLDRKFAGDTATRALHWFDRHWKNGVQI